MRKFLWYGWRSALCGMKDILSIKRIRMGIIGMSVRFISAIVC